MRSRSMWRPTASLWSGILWATAWAAISTRPAPEVRNFGPAGHGPRLQPGMTIAVEPMVCAGDWQVKVLADKWTTVSLDGSLTAHYENTILITEDGPEILTVTEDGAYV